MYWQHKQHSQDLIVVIISSKYYSCLAPICKGAWIDNLITCVLAKTAAFAIK
jgi:hypothetical protein